MHDSSHLKMLSRRWTCQQERNVNGRTGTAKRRTPSHTLAPHTYRCGREGEPVNKKEMVIHDLWGSNSKWLSFSHASSGKKIVWGCSREGEPVNKTEMLKSDHCAFSSKWLSFSSTSSGTIIISRTAARRTPSHTRGPHTWKCGRRGEPVKEEMVIHDH